jgi:hypothetical protein
MNERQEFIDSQRGKLEKTVLKLQGQLLTEAIQNIVPRLDVKDGVILDTTHNYRLLSDLDKVYATFQKISAEIVSAQMINGFGGVNELATEYFKVAFRDLPERFDRVIASVTKKVDLRIGIEGGKMVRSGFLDSFLKDNTVGTQAKNFMAKSITGQVSTKEFISGLSNIVQGDKGPGQLQKQYERLAFDLYQQYDAAYSSGIAEEFGMRYFIYGGTIMEDSRDFCVAHNNKVFSVEEAETWKDWVPADGEYPEGYEIRQKNIYEHPSYMDYPGYSPLIDRGGYNCRHAIGYISDDLAFDMRPELKNNN